MKRAPSAARPPLSRATTVTRCTAVTFTRSERRQLVVRESAAVCSASPLSGPPPLLREPAAPVHASGEVIHRPLVAVTVSPEHPTLTPVRVVRKRPNRESRVRWYSVDRSRDVLGAARHNRTEEGTSDWCLAAVWDVRRAAELDGRRARRRPFSRGALRDGCERHAVSTVPGVPGARGRGHRDQDESEREASHTADVTPALPRAIGRVGRWGHQGSERRSLLRPSGAHSEGVAKYPNAAPARFFPTTREIAEGLARQQTGWFSVHPPGGGSGYDGG